MSLSMVLWTFFKLDPLCHGPKQLTNNLGKGKLLPCQTSSNLYTFQMCLLLSFFTNETLSVVVILRCYQLLLVNVFDVNWGAST